MAKGERRSPHADSPTGYFSTSPRLELDDPEIVAWTTFAIEELERKAPRDGLQIPPAVDRAWAMVKHLHRRHQQAATRGLSTSKISDTSIESGATVETMTTAEVRDELGLESTQRVTQLCKQGRLTGAQRGRQWFIERASVEAEKARRAS